jgi:hypothetical protein
MGRNSVLPLAVEVTGRVRVSTSLPLVTQQKSNEILCVNPCFGGFPLGPDAHDAVVGRLARFDVARR